MVARNIEWIRPKYIKWVDKNQKERLYYPDFYLPEQSVYLDPKNKYCMERDQEKLEIVCKQILLIFGDISIVRDYVNQLN